MQTTTVAYETRTLPGETDPKLEIFAIGDVHGQAAVLSAILFEIGNSPRPANTDRIIIFLGDLIDRGPQSIEAVNVAMGAPETANADQVIMLPGNHELDFQKVLGGHNTVLWFQNGGRTVMEEVDPDYRAKPWADSLPKLTAAFPTDWITGIDEAPSHLVIGDLLFVHAGIDPKADRDTFLDRDRDVDDRHWATIRDEFTTWSHGWDQDDKSVYFKGSTVIVHGHTPAIRTTLSDTTEELSKMDGVDGYRTICLDAGAASRPQIGWARFWTEDGSSLVQIKATYTSQSPDL